MEGNRGGGPEREVLYLQRKGRRQVAGRYAGHHGQGRGCEREAWSRARPQHHRPGGVGKRCASASEELCGYRGVRNASSGLLGGFGVGHPEQGQVPGIDRGGYQELAGREDGDRPPEGTRGEPCAHSSVVRLCFGGREPTGEQPIQLGV